MKKEEINKIIFQKNYNLKIQLPEKFCNFNCSYCFQGKHCLPTKEEIKEIENNTYKIFEKIKSIYNNEKLNIDIIGGEPSLYNFEKSFELLKNYKNIKINLITNFSNNISYYIKLAKKFNIRFSISYHEENIDSFINKLKLLSFVSKPVVMVLVSNKTTLDFLNEINYKMNLNNLKVRYSISYNCKENKFDNIQSEILNLIYNFNNNTDDGLYSIINGKEHNLILSELYKIYYPNNINFKNYYCIPSYNIYTNGDIKIDCNNNIIGNIFNCCNFEFSKEKIKCNKECTGVFDYQEIFK